MSDRNLYDADFYTWTQRQAERLRGLSTEGPIDADLLAEEVADLGRGQLNKVREHLSKALVHLIKAAASTADRPVGHWMSEAGNHQRQAVDAFSPGMRQHIDLERLWDGALRDASDLLGDYGEPRLPLASVCPFALDDLLDPGFDRYSARDRVTASLSDAGHPVRRKGS